MDLTAPDVYYRLPVLAAASMILTMKVNMAQQRDNLLKSGLSSHEIENQLKSQNIMQYALYGLALVGIPIAGSFPMVCVHNQQSNFWIRGIELMSNISIDFVL